MIEKRCGAAIVDDKKKKEIVQMDSKGKIPYELLLNKKGRARLPDKLMDHLKNEELSDVIWWLPDGTSFAMDSKTVQEKFLDVHFRGTKLTSFIRSLNRWGFRRVFFHAMPRNAICFQSPKFKKDEPQLLREMKLAPTGGVTAAPAAAAAAVRPPPFASAAAHQGPGSVAAAAAAAASSSQVDALFGDARNRGRFGMAQAAAAASLPHAAALGGGLQAGSCLDSIRGGQQPNQLHSSVHMQSSLTNASVREQQEHAALMQAALREQQTAAALALGGGGVLGHAHAALARGPLGMPGAAAAAAAAASQLPFVGLSRAMGAQDSAVRQHTLALRALQEEELLRQIERQRGRTLSPNARTRDLDYFHSLVPPSANLRGNNNPLLGQHLHNRFSTLAGGRAAIRSPESKQEDPPGARDEADAAPDADADN